MPDQRRAKYSTDHSIYVGLDSPGPVVKAVTTVTKSKRKSEVRLYYSAL